MIKETDLTRCQNTSLILGSLSTWTELHKLCYESSAADIQRYLKLDNEKIYE